MPCLARISVTPVKGTALQHPASAEVTLSGIAENRRFFLVDDRGALFSGGEFGPLVRIEATYEPTSRHLRLRFPDGTVAEDEAVGSGDVFASDFYGRPVSAHEVPGPWSDAVSRYVGRPLRLLRCDRDGDGADELPLTLVSTASVEELAARGGYEGQLDARRFRINLQLGGPTAFEEDGWEGKALHVGDAVLEVGGQIPRCVVTTQSPDTGIKDWDTLAQIRRIRGRSRDGNGLPFGVYALVQRPGRVHTGDEVSLAHAS
jgi:uncharacterized protein YcbX